MTDDLLVGLFILLLASAWTIKVIKRKRDNGRHRSPPAQVHIDPNQGAATVVDSGRETVQLAGNYANGASGAREDSSIVLGEIIAYRCWQVAGDFLFSMNGQVWYPDEPMTGLGIDLNNSFGVHAFKKEAHAAVYTQGIAGIVAIGQVRLWGTIVEHERGYRGEFARPHAIILLDVHDQDRIFRLRQHYKIRMSP